MFPFGSVLCYGKTIPTCTNKIWCIQKDIFFVQSMLHTLTNFPLQHPCELKKCYYSLFTEERHQLLRQCEAV